MKQRLLPAAVAGLAVMVLAPSPAAVGGQDAGREVLLNPAAFTDTAPEMFHAVFTTTIGTVVVEVHRDWAPRGADRFYNLVKRGFYDECRFFRVVKDFVAQWGIHGDPKVNEAWAEAFIADDRARQSNTRRRVTFAKAGPRTRTTQVFINLGDNSKLDVDGFAPIGEVISSMLLVERLYSDYGEGPAQDIIRAGGNAFLAQYMPRLDYIRKATVEE